MVGTRLAILVAAGSLVLIGAPSPASAADATPVPQPTATATAVPVPSGTPELARRCLAARLNGQKPAECAPLQADLNKLLARIKVPVPVPTVRATPHFTG
jgi:hypothetical protein